MIDSKSTVFSVFGAVVIGMLFSWSTANGDVIRGRVNTESGSPISGVAMTIKFLGDQNQKSFSASTVTNEKGRYVFKDVPAGMYSVTAEKQGWMDGETIADAVPADSTAKGGSRIVLQLTPLYILLTNIQFSSTVYLAMFGLLILAFNFYWVPEPSKGVTISGWVVVCVATSIVMYRTGWRVGLPLGGIAAATGYLIQKYGHRTASGRLEQEAQQQQRHDDIDERERERVHALVGKNGVTVTDLKTCGTVKVDDTVIEARALHGFIPQDIRVVVTRIEGKTPIVERFQSPTAAS